MACKRRRGDTASGKTAYRLGLHAETVAALFLWCKGYRIVARRLKTPAGEIDLVVKRGRALAIVEVKARGRKAEAIEAIQPRQQQRLSRAVSHFLGRNPAYADFDIRFDVMLVMPYRLPIHLIDAWQP